MGDNPMMRTDCAAKVTLLLSLLSAACAGVSQRMTQAALAGDTEALNGLLKPDSPEVDTPFALEAAGNACPGQTILTPLQAAACAGQEAAVRKLLASGAKV